MTDFALQPTGIDPDVSASLAIYERIKPLKDALGIGNLTDGEMQVFALVARYTGLDPFTKQIYAIKRGGKVTHQTGIDGYRSTAERTHEYGGSSEAEFEDCDCGKDPQGHPKIARVVVHRIRPDGVIVNQTGIARWHGIYEPGEQTFMWRKNPFGQLAKCAEADGLRKAFPRVLGGVYITDEMQGADTIEGEAHDVTATPAPVTVADRIAARRAEREGIEPTSQEATSEPSVETEAAEDTPMSAESEAPAEAVGSRPAADAALCGEPSIYNDGDTCNLAAGHRPPHRILDGRGKASASW